MTASSWDHPDEPNPGNVERLLEGKVDGVRFANVEVRSEAAVLVWATHPELIKNVEFDRVSIYMEQSSKWPPRIDLRPNGEVDFIREPHSAVTLINAESISISNSKILWSEATKSKYKSALQVENVKNLVKHNFVFENPDLAERAIS